jgi:hypothetical protein
MLSGKPEYVRSFLTESFEYPNTRSIRANEDENFGPTLLQGAQALPCSRSMHVYATALDRHSVFKLSRMEPKTLRSRTSYGSTALQSQRPGRQQVARQRWKHYSAKRR